MSKTYTITPNIVGYKATSSVNGSSDDLTNAGSELRAYTASDSPNKRIGCTSGYSTGYAVRCNWPDTDEVNYLLSLPTGISITSISIAVTTTINASGVGIRIFHGPLYGSANGARLKTKCNTYRGFTEGTANFTLNPTVSKYRGSDGRSLCQYGFGLGGTRSSVYIATIKTITVTVTTDEGEHNLTTSVTPSGYGTVASTKNSGYYGDTSTLTATPTAATSQYIYNFSKWTVSDGSLSSTTSNPTTFTYANSDATVTATFTRTAKSYNFTAISSPNEGGIITPSSGIIAYGETKTLTASPASGYAVDYWHIDGDGQIISTSGNSISFTVYGSNLTITAYFKKELVNIIHYQTINGMVDGYIYYYDGTSLKNVYVYNSDGQTLILTK